MPRWRRGARQDTAALVDARAAGAALLAAHEQMTTDPFAPHPLFGTAPAEQSVWLAEQARLGGRDDAEV